MTLRLLQEDSPSSSPRVPLVEQLDAHTRLARERVWLHPFNAARRAARVPRALYAAELRAWRSVFEAVERRLSDHPVWHTELARHPSICHDLSLVDVRTHYIVMIAQRCAERWASQLARAPEPTLLATLYALERAVPGGTSEATITSRNLEITSSVILRFRLRNHSGEEWLRLGARLDEHGRDDDLRAELLDEASHALERVCDLLDALNRELRES